MMKKLSYLAAAFVSGVLLSVTINACGGDKENIGPGETQNPSAAAAVTNPQEAPAGRFTTGRFTSSPLRRTTMRTAS